VTAPLTVDLEHAPIIELERAAAAVLTANVHGYYATGARDQPDRPAHEQAGADHGRGAEQAGPQPEQHAREDVLPDVVGAQEVPRRGQLERRSGGGRGVGRQQRRQERQQDEGREQAEAGPLHERQGAHVPGGGAAARAGEPPHGAGHGHAGTSGTAASRARV